MQKYIELLQPTSWYDGRFTEPQGSLTAGTIFSNEGLTVIGDENQVYIQTKIDQQDAFIYLGQTCPQVNVASFTKNQFLNHQSNPLPCQNLSFDLGSILSLFENLRRH